MPNDKDKKDNSTLKLFASTTIKRGLVNRELAQKYAHSKEEDADLLSIEDTPSGFYLHTLMGENFSNDLDENVLVNRFIDTVKIGRSNPSDVQKEQFVLMLREERRHPETVVFYHGTDNEVSFINDVVTEFLKQLHHQYSDDFTALRAFPDLFADFDNVESFKNARVNTGFTNADWNPDYKELVISTNLFIFGSHESTTGECTAEFFLGKRSVGPPDVKKLFDYFIQRLQIEANYDDFKALYDTYLKDSGNTCYQIFIDKFHVDEVAYIAKEFGKPNPLECDGKKIENFSEILEVLALNPQKHMDYIKSLQARLYCHPRVLQDTDKVSIIKYSANPMSTQQLKLYRTELADQVSRCLSSFLARPKPISSDDFTNGEPSLVKQMKMVAEKTADIPYVKLPSEIILIPELIRKGKVEDLATYLTNNNVDFSQMSLNRAHYWSNVPFRLGDFFLNHMDVTKQLITVLDEVYKRNPDNTNISNALQQLNWIKLCDGIKKADIKTCLESIMVLNEERLYSTLAETELNKTIDEKTGTGFVSDSTITDRISYYSCLDIFDPKKTSQYKNFSIDLYAELSKIKNIEMSHPRLLESLKYINLLVYISESCIDKFVNTALQIKNLDLNKLIIIPDSFAGSLSAVTLSQVLRDHPDRDKIYDSLKHTPGFTV